MVCDIVVCERWCVTKLRVKNGVCKMVCERVRLEIQQELVIQNTKLDVYIL